MVHALLKKNPHEIPHTLKLVSQYSEYLENLQVLEFISDFEKPTAPLLAAMVPCIQTRVQVGDIDEIEFKISPETQAPGRKRDSQEDMIEKNVEKKNTPTAVDDPYAVAFMVDTIPLW